MSLSSDTILSVNLINHKGRQFFQDRWDVFVETLREGLQQAGRLDTQQSKENLFIFSFNHPFTALASCLESIDRAKAALAWKEEYGASAIQIVMHLDNATDRYNDIYDVTAAMWNFLQHESIYVSRSMKSKWPQLMEGRKLPSLSIDNESGGVFLLKFHEPAKIEIDRLFPHRQLALNGPEKECFYCGRTDHIPAKCPCKYLTMGIKALPFVGFMTFSELSRIYSDVFSHPDVVLAKLSAGIEPGSIKTDSAMLVYLAYFDLFRVYQPRFLYHISFTNYTRWEEIGRMDRSRIDNNNLNMGFDCLRVGQYGHAQKWLSSDSLRNDGKEFHASVGLAFLALEQGREKDMGTLLERARDLADSEKNSIYVSLLLARYYYLNNDLWKAEQEASSVLAIHDQCAEAKFAKIKIGVSSGFIDQAFSQVIGLIKDSREFFMASLMDSGLTPIQGLVEEVLTTHFHNLGGKAKTSLAEVNKAWKKLNEWLGERGDAGKNNEKTVAALQNHFDRGTYYDLLKVQSRSKAVVAACHRIHRERLEFLDDKIIAMLSVWDDYHTFWINYPYQSLFKSFINKLDEFNTDLLKLQRAVKNDKNMLFDDAMSMLDKLQSQVGFFKPQVDNMIWAREAVEIGKNFFKKLLLLEVTINLLSFVALTFFSVIIIDVLPDDAKQLLGSSWFHKRTYMISSFLASPIIALALVFLDNTGRIMAHGSREFTEKVNMNLSENEVKAEEPAEPEESDKDLTPEADAEPAPESV